MPISLPWVIAAIFGAAVIVVLILIAMSRKPDVDISIGKKLGILIGPGGKPRLQMKVTFSKKKHPVVVNRTGLVLNSDAPMVAEQYVEDIGIAYMGAKAQVVPIRVESEHHESIEFGFSNLISGQWKPGPNLLLLKIWLEPNLTQHNPSKMYKIEFFLDDHVIAAVMKHQTPAQDVMYTNVTSLNQVFPPVSFKLVKPLR